MFGWDRRRREIVSTRVVRDLTILDASRQGLYFGHTSKLWNTELEILEYVGRLLRARDLNQFGYCFVQSEQGGKVSNFKFDNVRGCHVFLTFQSHKSGCINVFHPQLFAQNDG